MKLFTVLLLQAIIILCSAKQYHRHGGHYDHNSNARHVRLPSGKSYNVLDPKVPRHMRCGKFDAVEVSHSSDIYKAIMHDVTEGSDLRMSAVKVRKILNRCVWERYQARRDKIRHSSWDGAHERLLYHGAGASTLNVLKDGFTRHYPFWVTRYTKVPALYFESSVLNAGDYTWLSPKRKSKQGDILLCRVATGQVDMRSLDKKNRQPAPAGYHSTLFYDEYTAERTYTIDHVDQVYPEYLVTIEDPVRDDD